MPYDRWRDLGTEADRLVRLKSDCPEFLVEIIHEIRNPSTTIWKLPELIVCEADNLDHERILHFFQVMHRQLDYHLRVAQILDFYNRERDDIPDTFPEGIFEDLPQDITAALDPRDRELLTMTPRAFMQGLAQRLQEQATAIIAELPSEGAELEVETLVEIVQRIRLSGKRIYAVINVLVQAMIDWLRMQQS